MNKQFWLLTEGFLTYILDNFQPIMLIQTYFGWIITMDTTNNWKRPKKNYIYILNIFLTIVVTIDFPSNNMSM